MLQSLIDEICRRSPLQAKVLAPFLAAVPDQYWQRGNDFVRRYDSYLRSIGLDLHYAAEAYLQLCTEILNATVAFRRSGHYACPCQNDAYRDVYSQEKTMRDYMVALAVTQFLWKNHYAMYACFWDLLAARGSGVRDYLEIGPGHGAYLAAAMQALPARRFTVLDLSPTSLRLCQESLPFLVDSPPTEIAWREQDALAMPDDCQFDWITMGEVLEHLDDPRPILHKIRRSLRPNGIAFITTCANCPTKDHVYLFRNAVEIRELIESCGLAVDEELALRLDPSAPPSRHDLVNYAAVVRVRG